MLDLNIDYETIKQKENGKIQVALIRTDRTSKAPSRKQRLAKLNLRQ